MTQRGDTMNRLIAPVLIVSALAFSAAFAKGPKGDFSRFDADGDGKVAIAEIEGRAREFVSAADADKDGYITKDEMEAFHQSRRAEREARRFPDADNDGYVSRREFEDAARIRFDELDANGDGLISRDEAPEHHGRRGGKR